MQRSKSMFTAGQDMDEEVPTPTPVSRVVSLNDAQTRRVRIGDAHGDHDHGDLSRSDPFADRHAYTPQHAFGNQPATPRRHRRTFSDPGTLSQMASAARLFVDTRHTDDDDDSRQPLITPATVVRAPSMPTPPRRAQRFFHGVARLLRATCRPVLHSACGEHLVDCTQSMCRRLKRRSHTLRRPWLAAGLALFAVLLVLWGGWHHRGAESATAVRLQRVLLPPTLLEGGRNDYGAPTPRAADLDVASGISNPPAGSSFSFSLVQEAVKLYQIICNVN